MSMLKLIFRLRPLTILLFSLCVICSGATVSLAAEIEFAWDANFENDLVGYRIYYSIGSQDGSFDGTGLTQGASPISVSLDDLETLEFPTYLLSGLTVGETYFFAITAYDEDGLESDYSNVVRYEVPAEDGESAAASGYAIDSGAIAASGESDNTAVMLRINGPLEVATR
jgi:fibronectin type 3 domain-containing protein